ncbi:pro-sigmaK processing inhibitor BofA family protein [Halococcoides cellulosivorans]|uniref:Transcriptional regulator n=1 Tax=Halococcoides cellulosivorans TaxID=1679096 RepID=A0A2R4X0G0_9EURY|nr:pro-sigmaK processing inhibitor BofA family protein [Halococcoides cellulosivorans]AWB27279.1 transcriptional regulator [Halococcoides cellulosivorans]
MASRTSRSTLGTLLVNAIVGLAILIVANAVGLGVQISAVTLLVCAVFGVPGAILVLALALFDVAFVATLVPVDILAVLL